MRARLRHLALLAPVIAITSIVAPTEDQWEKYQRRTLQSIIDSHHDDIERLNSDKKALLLTGDSFPSQTELIYLGESRPLPHVQSVLFDFWRKMHKDQAPAPDEFPSEMLFREGTERRWIAVQKPLIEPLTKEVQKGQQLNAYVIWIGATMKGENWEWLFAMNRFQAQRTPDPSSEPIIDVRGPTIVAFFRPLKPDQKDADANESLADFQYYVKQIRKPLADAGIELQETYSDLFRVKVGESTTTFRPDKEGVGYYLVAPGKPPRIEYGVMTDHDLRELAQQYFGRQLVIIPHSTR
jgi:hypothetical protein